MYASISIACSWVWKSGMNGRWKERKARRGVIATFKVPRIKGIILRLFGWLLVGN
jgi:hypothetical protein